MRQYILDRGFAGIGIFILLQILQVVVAALPGEVVQIAGGYLFGTLWGSIYLIIGVTIGSIIVFGVTKLLGHRLVKIFVPQHRLEKLYVLLTGPRPEMIIFLLFLIPGLPKDILTYIGGLTPVRPGRFLPIAVLGRLPALVVSAYIGSSLEQGNLIVAIVISSVATLLFFTGLLYKDKILARWRVNYAKRRGDE